MTTKSSYKFEEVWWESVKENEKAKSFTAAKNRFDLIAPMLVKEVLNGLLFRAFRLQYYVWNQ